MLETRPLQIFESEVLAVVSGRSKAPSCFMKAMFLQEAVFTVLSNSWEVSNRVMKRIGFIVTSRKVLLTVKRVK